MNKIPFRKFSHFRETFSNDKVNYVSWFPGHMYKGMMQMQAKLAVVDCIIEVHDARIPFSGRNPKFYSMLYAIKPHILVLNKSDLADLSQKNKIKEGLLKENIQHVIFANCKDGVRSGVHKIIPTAVEMMQNSEKYNRENSSSFSLMVIGIPNVGKSSLINRLRNMHLKKSNATSVGAIPGVTRSVLEKIKISDNPLIYLFDTPGIMQPSIDNLDVALRLALCRTLSDRLVGEEIIADYLLYWLNKQKNFSYVDYLKLNEPVDDVRLLIIHIAKEFNKILKVKDFNGSIIQVPDTQQCAMYFIKAFRQGLFGKVMLDNDYVNKL